MKNSTTNSIGEPMTSDEVREGFAHYKTVSDNSIWEHYQGSVPDSGSHTYTGYDNDYNKWGDIWIKPTTTSGDSTSTSISTSTTLSPPILDKVLWENARWQIGKNTSGNIALQNSLLGQWFIINYEVIMMNFIWNSRPPQEYKRIPKHVLLKYSTFTKMKRML